jgi:ABC-type multidrug transport system ATPase subunit
VAEVAEVALSIEAVTKSFAGTRVLDGVDLTLRRGEICVLRGSNGAGKSTLLDIVSGVLEADAGAVQVFGVARTTWRRRALVHVGYAPSNASLPESLAVHELLDLVAALRGGVGTAEVDALSATWGIDAFVDARLAVLSLGQRRRLVLALGELGRPPLRILDEPTVGLDDQGQELLFARLRAHAAAGGAVLVASHEEPLAMQLGATERTLRAGRMS